ncbi:hypothetical protein GCM10018790_16810 [Kitasatospora xanthocidica]|nr:hypothetical protein GCM10018790_16810 [Kitasatospora xanthocidica]
MPDQPLLLEFDERVERLGERTGHGALGVAEPELRDVASAVVPAEGGPGPADQATTGDGRVRDPSDGTWSADAEGLRLSA